VSCSLTTLRFYRKWGGKAQKKGRKGGKKEGKEEEKGKVPKFQFSRFRPE
jgi:hypothetical protein